MKLRDLLKPLKDFIGRFEKLPFDSTDIPLGLVILGLLLIGYGGAQYHRGLGHLLAGLVLIVYVRPLARWLK